MLWACALFLFMALWLLLAVTVVVGGYQLYRHRQTLAADRRALPSLVHVRALALTEPCGDVVDGVSLRPGERILVWAQNRTALWRRRRKDWVRTDELRRLVPGSLIQVREGLTYAETSFSVRGPDSLLPTWQHWLLSDEALKTVPHDTTTTLVLQVQGHKLWPRPLDDIPLNGKSAA